MKAKERERDLPAYERSMGQQGDGLERAAGISKCLVAFIHSLETCTGSDFFLK